MEPDTAKIWTRPEVRVSVGKLIVESLGVDEANVTADAALVRDLGAESIDFLDLSFKCQQTFGVDLPMRLIQERRRVDDKYMAAWFQYAPVSHQAPKKMGRVLSRSETAKT